MTQPASIQTLVSKLTLEEKASLCSGASFWTLKSVERLGLPGIMMTDGPHGLRKQKGSPDQVGLGDSVPTTCFPPAVTTASSWNPKLLKEIGVALGEECLQEDVAVLLGPGVNLKRSPLGGRNFEYFSEDPFLAGRLAAAWISGVQSQGVGASLKHFAANNQETQRMVIDTIVDERTLRELYLSAFEFAVKDSQPWTVMCAYNMLNGTCLSEHHELLTTILKQEWGHEGLVVSDWMATSDRVAGLKAGLELEMPSSHGINDDRIVAAIAEGRLTTAELDAAVTRLVALILKAVEARKPGFRYDVTAHHELARRAAEESLVLLKNEAGRLPLSPSGRIAVVGALAQSPRYQGAGSSQIVPTRLDSPLEAIREVCGPAAVVSFAEGYSLVGDTIDASTEAEAVEVARGATTVIVVLGLPQSAESEAFDRKHMRLPENQLSLIGKILDAAPHAVVVLQNGSPVELPFAHRASALLEAYLGGQGGGMAVARVLFGLAEPGGRLAETFPLRIEDCPSTPWFPGSPRQVEYREGLWVGYRYFQTAGVPVAFPFGHGLSYTSFEYSQLEVTPTQATVTVRNSGSRSGWEVVQLYIRDVDSSVYRPALELKGFAKLWLEPGESQTVSFALDTRSFAFWDVARHAWRVESGTFEVMVGASAADLRLRANLDVVGEAPGRSDSALDAYRRPASTAAQFDQRAYEALLGRPLPVASPARPYHLNSTLGEIRQNFVGGFLYRQVKAMMGKQMGAGTDPGMDLMLIAMMEGMPLRVLAMLSQGTLNFQKLGGLVDLMNGRFFQGFKKLVL